MRLRTPATDSFNMCLSFPLCYRDSTFLLKAFLALLLISINIHNLIALKFFIKLRPGLNYQT